MSQDFAIPQDSGIPDYMRQSIEDYINLGAPIGDFLTAVFSNDLLNAFGRADDANNLAMRDYVMLIYNDMPYASHGSRQEVAAWIASGGYRGRNAA